MISKLKQEIKELKRTIHNYIDLVDYKNGVIKALL